MATTVYCTTEQLQIELAALGTMWAQGMAESYMYVISNY